MRIYSIIKKSLLILVAVIFANFLTIEICIGSDFCEFIDQVQNKYCKTTTTTITEPEYCGYVSRAEIEELDIINSRYETFWDTDYRLISIDSLREFLKYNRVRDVNNSPWFDCDDYCKVLLGKVMEWAPGIAFGITWTTNDDNTWAHATCIMIDCNFDVWLIEPQGNRIYLRDEVDSVDHVILLWEE